MHFSVNKKTKSDTWIKNQIYLNSGEINRCLQDVMFFYNHNPVKIIFKAEDQSPYLDVLKTYSDVFTAGNMTARRFVKDVYKNLSQSEQEDEIQALELSQSQRQTIPTQIPISGGV